MKFINLSPPADFYLKFQTQIDILMKNVLYITHEVDKIKKLVNKIDVNSSLQTQVDEYFDKNEEESFHETSPQTESMNK